MLVAVGNVLAKKRQLLGGRHDLEIPLQTEVHFGAVDRRAVLDHTHPSKCLTPACGNDRE